MRDALDRLLERARDEVGRHRDGVVLERPRRTDVLAALDDVSGEGGHGQMRWVRGRVSEGCGAH